ncbi:MAG TPA: right-handed parallel beta-helix repeat-containing protein [Baekduia sp.]|jgi:hypothetical protein|nr:right-handed parallel beta-helix repeat-containing protein [Baekduia sp.]
MSQFAHAATARRIFTARRRRTIAIASLLAGASMGIAPCAGASDTNATPANLKSVYASAQGGDVIHLAPGSYGAFTGGSKASPVTIVAPAGTTASMSLQLSGAQNVVIDGVTVTEAYLNEVHGVTIRNSVFQGMTRVDAATGNANLLFDHNTFSAVDPCSACYEGRLTVRGNNTSDRVTPAGVTITNNLFGPGGTADGVQIIGDALGVQVGPGNEFTGLAQSSAANAAHTDPIQLYGSIRTVITGNWLHNNATGIMAPDGSDHETVTNNVIQTTGYPWPIVMGAATGNTVAHNTLPGSAGVMEIDKSNGGAASSGNVVQDNVMAAITNAQGGVPTGLTQDYNLLASGNRGAHDIKGKPTFSLGANPTSYAGYVLSATSAGAGRASDGTNMGINPAPSGGSPGAGGSPGSAGATTPSSTAPASTGPGATAGPGLAALPTVRLRGIKAGHRFSRRLGLTLASAGGVGVDHVGFWLGRHWISTDRRAPYRLAWRVPRATKLGFHTLSARVFTGDGRVSSVSLTVRRVGRGTRRASTAHAIALRATPSSTGATILSGDGRPRRRVRVELAGCHDAGAVTVQRLTLRATAKGQLSGGAPRADLCVTALRPL